jgi:hypothetical protein
MRNKIIFISRARHSLERKRDVLGGESLNQNVRLRNIKIFRSAAHSSTPTPHLIRRSQTRALAPIGTGRYYLSSKGCGNDHTGRTLLRLLVRKFRSILEKTTINSNTPSITNIVAGSNFYSNIVEILPVAWPVRSGAFSRESLITLYSGERRPFPKNAFWAKRSHSSAQLITVFAPLS